MYGSGAVLGTETRHLLGLAPISSLRLDVLSLRGSQLWVKGATSGHTQAVREVRLDCDGDTLLVLVDQSGAACHTGDRTCFDADVLLA